MRNAILTQAATFTAGLALLLAGCGDSHPIAEPAAPASAPASAVPAYAPSSGRFSMVSAGDFPGAVEPSGKCNLDAIDGAVPGSKPLARGASALFAGWAAANDAASVPDKVTLVLSGNQDFALQAPAGAPRPDVASANRQPLLAKSGYEVNADLSAVPAGDYKVELRYDAGGKAWRCEASHAVKIR